MFSTFVAIILLCDDLESKVISYRCALLSAYALKRPKLGPSRDSTSAAYLEMDAGV